MSGLWMWAAVGSAIAGGVFSAVSMALPDLSTAGLLDLAARRGGAALDRAERIASDPDGPAAAAAPPRAPLTLPATAAATLAPPPVGAAGAPPPPGRGAAGFPGQSPGGGGGNPVPRPARPWGSWAPRLGVTAGEPKDGPNRVLRGGPFWGYLPEVDGAVRVDDP